MATKLEALVEAERRGILPTKQQEILNEARRRGLVPARQRAPYAAIPSPTMGPERVSMRRTKGLARGLRDIPDAGAQIATRGVEKALEVLAPTSNLRQWATKQRQNVEAINQEAEREYQEAWMKDQQEGTDVPRLVGNILGVAGLMPTAGGAATLPGRMAGGAAAGATAGALQPVTEPEDFWTEKAQQAGLGALGGGVAPLATGAVSRVISPMSSKAVQMLRQEGVRAMTPGQVLGGPARWLEEKAASIPFVGEAIRLAEGRSLEMFNRAAVNKALKFAGLSLPKGVKAGHDAIEAAGRALSNGYDDALKGVSVVADQQFARDLDKIATGAVRDLPPSLQKVLFNQLDDLFRQQGMQGNAITGDLSKKVASELGRLSSRFRKSADPFQRDLGAAFGETRRAFNNLLMRNVSPDKAAQLKGLDRAYTGFLRIENAAARTGAKEGVFSPAQLKAAARSMDTSLRKRAFARGTAPVQEFAEAGQGVLGRSVPDSGTAGRAMLGGALLTGGAGVINPYLGAGVGAGGLMYTPWGQRLLTELLAGRQGPIAQGVAQVPRLMAPFVAPAAGATTARR